MQATAAARTRMPAWLAPTQNCGVDPKQEQWVEGGRKRPVQPEARRADWAAIWPHTVNKLNYHRSRGVRYAYGKYMLPLGLGAVPGADYCVKSSCTIRYARNELNMVTTLGSWEKPAEATCAISHLQERGTGRKRPGAWLVPWRTIKRHRTLIIIMPSARHHTCQQVSCAVPLAPSQPPATDGQCPLACSQRKACVLVHGRYPIARTCVATAPQLIP